MASFDLQGHRGARGLRPENTLPSFETALDVGVSSIETDVHLTRDSVAVLIHDARLSAPTCRPLAGSRALLPGEGPLFSALNLPELRGYVADGNPDAARFPLQDSGITPLARLLADDCGFHPYAIPTLHDLLAFLEAYGGDLGHAAGKTAAQQARARQVRLDLELKRVPFHPETIGDDFDGVRPGLLERQVVDAVRASGVGARTSVRSFDHRSVRAIRMLAPEIETALLVAGTALLSPGRLCRDAGCRTYCPDFEFLDEAQVREAHAESVRVVPWTVNEPDDWQRLLDWGVDGIATDYPDRLAEWLRARGISF